MGNLAYLLSALAVSAVVSLLLWLRQRQPRSVEAGVEAFARERRAMEPKRRPRAPPPP